MNEIAKPQNVINSMDDIERAARAMSESKFFADSKDAAQAIVKILAGRELGFGAFASMTGVAVIQGKPVVGANLTAAAIKQTGKYNYRVTTHTDVECAIDFYEGKEKVGTSTFTIKDAQSAGLTNKDNWRKYPRNMLFARAISNGQKWFAPDVYNGVTVYTPDELGATVDEDGNFLEAEIIAETRNIQNQKVTVDVVNQEVHYDHKPTKPNEIINDDEWEKFGQIVQRAASMGIELPEYNREKMTASTINGATKYILGKIEKAGK